MPQAVGLHQTTCRTCGSQISYLPGTASTKCGACGGAQEIEAADDDEIEEHSFEEWMATNGHTLVASVGAQVVSCQGCGATLETTSLSESCQFCGGHLVALATPPGVIQPEAVVPFGIDQAGANAAFKKWVSNRRFAPNALRQVGAADSLQGTYLPHWTFDADTKSSYSGRRGDHYYVTKTRQVSDGKGGTRTETYQERKTRWTPVSGRVSRSFDDVIVCASEKLEADQVEKMGPWELGSAVPFQPAYLAGYSALRYDTDPTAGSETARAAMRTTIESDVRDDIGGDEQEIRELDVSYRKVQFKLVLLPLWLANYKFAGKQWPVMVNANTGKVVGDRPYSKAKIAAVVLLVLIVLATIAVLVMSGGESSASVASHLTTTSAAAPFPGGEPGLVG